LRAAALTVGDAAGVHTGTGTLDGESTGTWALARVDGPAIWPVSRVRMFVARFSVGLGVELVEPEDVLPVAAKSS